MKIHKQICPLFMAALASLLLYSCQTHDLVGDLGKVSDYGPNSNLVIINTQPTAGQTIDCDLQYWTIGDKITYLRLWEKMDRNYTYKMTVPSINYIYTQSMISLERDLQEVAPEISPLLEPLPSFWVDSLKAYAQQTPYRVSDLYKNFVYKDTRVFDADQIEKYYPANYADSLYINIVEDNNRKSLKALIITTFGRELGFITVVDDEDVVNDEEFENLYVSTEEDDSTLKDPIAGTQWLLDHVEEIGMERLIKDPTTGTYAVYYQQQFTITLSLKVKNEKEVSSFSDELQLIVN